MCPSSLRAPVRQSWLEARLTLVVQSDTLGDLDGTLPDGEVRRSRLQEEEWFWVSRFQLDRPSTTLILTLGDGIAKLFGMVGVVTPNSDDLGRSVSFSLGQQHF